MKGTPMSQLIAYLRVSTRKQGASGLGLAAQREAVRNYAEANGTILAEYVEVESGRKAGRPKLAEALAARRLPVPAWWLPSWIGCPATWPSWLP